MWLLVTSFKKLLGGALLTLYVDNDGVTAAYIKGSSVSPEVNSMAAIFWFFVSKAHFHPMIYRVEIQPIERRVPHALMTLVVRYFVS